jgi:nitroimidazol reductase NimA-like FMN-containing flavoprotein (pyridoxamine 5'-phosphate oxidase superfamily)
LPKNTREIQDYVNRARLASFVTVDSENKPHVVPVFFTYDNGRVYIQTDRSSVKVRNLLKNNNVAVAIYSGEEAVVIKGVARVVDSGEEFRKRTQDHIGKYELRLDRLGRDSLGIPLFDENRRCVVEVSSKRTIYW